MTFPKNFEYSSDSDHLPIEFYLNALPQSKEVLLKLGYFSSNAIGVLAYGFARFIYHGGKMKIVSNHFMTDRDKELIAGSSSLVSQDPLLQNLAWLKAGLSDNGEHFFSCLKYLVKNNRLQIVPVLLKPNGMAHYKQGLFIDGSGDQIYIDGSCNFTGSGLLENGESLKVFRSWGSEYEATTIQGKYENINSIIQHENERYEYLTSDDILSSIHEYGEDKTLQDLLLDELKLLKENECSASSVIKKLIREAEDEIKGELDMWEKKPRFPYESGPRAYQAEATEKWIDSGGRGLFAMATGTGKTITALNCLLEEFKDKGVYQSVILVPTKDLIEQWCRELDSFNFKSVILAYSSNSKWKGEVNTLLTRLRFDCNSSFVIVCTYKGFSSDFWSSKVNCLPKSTILIADEAHNIASPRMKIVLDKIQFYKRLGLSATPNRKFDTEGDKAINNFFDTAPPYTFSYSMERAIKNGVLCQYYYHPRIVFLTDDELEEYKEISSQLSRYFALESEGFLNNERVKILLLQRKRIIHKAANKITAFKCILNGKKNENTKGLKYTFIYVPEGSDQEDHALIDSFCQVYGSIFPESRAYQYTSKTENKKEVLKLFDGGQIQTLFAMKCLDEGVDIPRTECAIFCSSTGNPRQFIQRRGRVLRTHPDKRFAEIHDLVVVPTSTASSIIDPVEKKMMREELVRVIYFASLSMNYYSAMEVCRPIAEQYGLDIFALEDELRNPDE